MAFHHTQTLGCRYTHKQLEITSRSDGVYMIVELFLCVISCSFVRCCPVSAHKICPMFYFTCACMSVHFMIVLGEVTYNICTCACIASMIAVVHTAQSYGAFKVCRASCIASMIAVKIN